MDTQDERKIFTAFSKWLNAVEAKRKGGLPVTPGEVTERFLRQHPQFSVQRRRIRQRAKELINWRGGDFLVKPEAWK